MSGNGAAAGSVRSRRRRRSYGLPAGLFFNSRPSPLPPNPDSSLIPLPCPARRPLRTPAQADQNLPYMTFVVANAELLLDQIRHSRTGPQRCLVPQSFRTLQQQFFQPLPVLLSQQRLAACPARSPQCPLALLPILPSPPHHRLPCHPHSPCGLRVTESFLHQPHRFKPALLQRLKVASYPCWISHAPLDARPPPKVSLYYAGVIKLRGVVVKLPEVGGLHHRY